MSKLKHLLKRPFTSFSAKHKQKNLQHRFIVGVLALPFLVLLIVGTLTVFYIESVVENKAIEGINRAAVTTALKLEREFSIRKTILVRTGEDLTQIKTDYSLALTKLESDREACSNFIKQNRKFLDAPNEVCNPFLPEFAKARNDNVSQQLTDVETGYKRNAIEFEEINNQAVKDKIKAYTQFFPETVALMVVNKDKEVVSTASSVDLKDTTDELKEVAISAQKELVEGKIIENGGLRLAVFAYPVTGGSVLATYDLSSDSFVKETWENTPLDESSELAVILDSEGKSGYPNVSLGDALSNVNAELRSSSFQEVKLKNINHIASASEVNGASRWIVVVASPTAAVFSPVRNAQLLAVIIVGSLLIGFLWVGTYFIKRTISSISGLVVGAQIFSSNKLDYRIELKDPDQEFEVLADTLNSMADRIAAAEKEIDEKNKEFISIATHELRTPLTAIKGNLSMAYEDMGDSLPEDVKPMIADAFKGTNRLAILVNDMLDMARLEGGRVEFVIEPTDIGEVALDVVDSLQVTAQEKQITLNYNNLNAQKILVDGSKLRIVLNNFISNAIKYNRPNGTVTISHSLANNRLVTAVADTGLGIPEDQKQHMFEKFFRVQNNDRKDVVGTGLGMYITKQYIESMGGKLWFESVHGQGTTFYFDFPLATANPVSAVSSSVPDQPVSLPTVPTNISPAPTAVSDDNESSNTSQNNLVAKDNNALEPESITNVSLHPTNDEGSPTPIQNLPEDNNSSAIR